MGLVLELLQRLTTDKVVVEFDDVAIAKVPWRKVIILDVFGYETASKRGVCLKTIGAERPFFR